MRHNLNIDLLTIAYVHDVQRGSTTSNLLQNLGIGWIVESEKLTIIHTEAILPEM